MLDGIEQVERPAAYDVARAIGRYFDGHGLRDHYTFEKDVVKVVPNKSGMYVQLSSDEWHGPYAYVVHTSHATLPRVPPGCNVASQYHSSNLDRSVVDRLVASKGTLLVVGGSKSAYDAVLTFAKRKREVVWISHRIQPVGEYAGVRLARVRWMRFLSAITRGYSAKEAMLTAALTLSADDQRMCPSATPKQELNLLTLEELNLIKKGSRIVCGNDIRPIADGIMVDGSIYPAAAIVWATGYVPEKFLLHDARYIAIADFYDPDGIGMGGFATAEAFARAVEKIVCDSYTRSDAIAQAKREKIPYVISRGLGLRLDMAHARTIIAAYVGAIVGLVIVFILFSTKIFRRL